MESVGTPASWVGFTALIGVLLVVDLAVHRGNRVVHPREALVWTAVWIALALGFNGLVYAWFGAQPALEFFTGYLIEKALSVDNLFVFLVLFSYFAVPAALQHRVLFWGILGAMVMRALFVVAGAALIQRFHWVIYGFGALLLLTGAKLFLGRHTQVHPERSRIFRAFERLMPTVPGYDSGRFTVVEHGRRHATPLLLVLVTVEASDILFAIDSVPAIFGITQDPFIVYTSNIFAILGMRSLYFVLAGALARFCYLQVGLAAVLCFIGAKMVLSGVMTVPIGISLGVIGGILGIAVVASIVRARAEPPGVSS